MKIDPAAVLSSIKFCSKAKVPASSMQEFLSTVKSGSVLKVQFGDTAFTGCLLRKHSKTADPSLVLYNRKMGVEMGFKAYSPLMREIQVLKVPKEETPSEMNYLKKFPNQAPCGFE